MSSPEIAVRITVDATEHGLEPATAEGLAQALLAHDVDAIVWAAEVGSVAVEVGDRA